MDASGDNRDSSSGSSRAILLLKETPYLMLSISGVFCIVESLTVEQTIFSGITGLSIGILSLIVAHLNLRHR